MMCWSLEIFKVGVWPCVWLWIERFGEDAKFLFLRSLTNSIERSIDVKAPTNHRHEFSAFERNIKNTSLEDILKIRHFIVAGFLMKNIFADFFSCFNVKLSFMGAFGCRIPTFYWSNSTKLQLSVAYYYIT